jgi:hypothetical protein
VSVYQILKCKAAVDSLSVRPDALRNGSKEKRVDGGEGNRIEPARVVAIVCYGAGFAVVPSAPVPEKKGETLNARLSFVS